jgi:hypothetical protein
VLINFKILPLTYRAKGVSISTATNWAFNWIVGAVTPELQDVLHWKLYPLFSIFCVLSFILGTLTAAPLRREISCKFATVYYLYPETMGVPLEEMDAVFGEGQLTRSISCKQC